MAVNQTSEKDQRRLEALHLQKMEGNPLDAEDIAMFEMFDRLGWSNGQRRAYIVEQAKAHVLHPAAE